jgi:hypothetical protein
MHDDEIGSRTSAWAVGVSGTLLSSSTNVGFAGLSEVTGKGHHDAAANVLTP